MTKNNQYKNLIDSSKVLLVLDFRTQIGTRCRTRDADLKTKTSPVIQTLNPGAVIQSIP